MKNCTTLPIFTRQFYSDPFCRKACADSKSAEKPSTTHCFHNPKPQQWPVATLREARAEVNTTRTQEAARSWDVGEVGLNLLMTQLWTAACTRAPGCNTFFSSRDPLECLGLYKGRNTRNQATRTLSRAMLQSKPKHPNPGKANASSKSKTISICAGHQEELSTSHSTHARQGARTRELALNAGAAGT